MHSFITSLLCGLCGNIPMFCWILSIISPTSSPHHVECNLINFTLGAILAQVILVIIIIASRVRFVRPKARSRSVRVLFRLHSWSFWGSFGVRLGSVRHSFGIRSGPVPHLFGVRKFFVRPPPQPKTKRSPGGGFSGVAPSLLTAATVPTWYICYIILCETLLTVWTGKDDSSGSPWSASY